MERTFYSRKWVRRAIRLTAMTALAGSVACGGCGQDNNDVELFPALTIQPINQSFGEVGVGETSSAVDFTVTNGGTGASGNIAVSIGGVNGGDFAVASDDCSGETLAPDATCTISVEFTAGASGDRAASLDVTADGDTISANLTGSGAEPGELSISPTPHTFATTVVGDMSATMDFTVTNTGGSVTGELASNLSAGDATEFSITDDGCNGSTLDPEATCTITAQFNPTSTGMKSTSIRVVGGSDDGEATAALSGNAIAEATLAGTPGVGDFGSVTVGQTSTNLTFTITNGGGGPSGALTTTLAGADAGDFTVTTDACDGSTLAAGANCTIIANFTPSSTGPKAGTLEVAGMPGGTASIALSGNGLDVAAITAAPSTNDYGTVTVGDTSAPTTYTVTNNGDQATGALSVSLIGANPGDFVLGANTCSGALAGMATCTVAVSFGPTADGNRAAQLSINGAPGGNATVGLSGVGETSAQLALAPGFQTFGSVDIGTTSNAVTFTVTNTGMQDSGIPSVGLGGADFSQFTIVADGCTAPLAATETCDVDVAFAPTATGNNTATLDVSATPGGSVSANLGGTGVQPSDLVVDTSVLQFGDVVNGGTSALQTVTVSNTGGTASGTISTAITGQFNIVNDTCGGQALAAGSNCQVSAEFAPTTLGAASGTLTIQSPSSTRQVSLSGTSVDEFIITPSFPDTYSYGTVLIGMTASQTFTVTNSNAAGSTSRQLTAALTADPAYVVDFNNCDGTPVAPNGSCQIGVDFAPTLTPGTKTGNITVTDQFSVSRVKNLTGLATSNENLDISPASYDFVDVNINTTETQTFNVTNTTATPTGPLQIVWDNNNDPFSVVSDTCSGNTLDAFQGANFACAITVIYYPTAVGNDGIATFTIDSATSSDISPTVTITGNAIAPAILDITGSESFGTRVSTFTGTDVRTYTVTNIGGEPTGPITTTLTNTVGTSFTIGNNTCVGALATLDPAESCTITVDVTTTTATPLGLNEATLTVSSNPGGSDVRNLAMLINPRLAMSPLTQTFASTVVNGESNVVTFTITNNGADYTAAPPVITTGPFTIETNTCDGSNTSPTCTVDVKFTPTTVGDDQTGTLEVGSGASGTAIAELEGDAFSDAALAFIGGVATDFGYANVGGTGIQRTFQVQNVGDTPALVDAAAASFDPATDPPDHFTVDATDCDGTTLNPGTVCDVIVTFSPDAAGVQTLDIIITADGAVVENVTATLTVTGEGRTAPAADDYRIDPRFYEFPNLVASGASSLNADNETFTVTNGTAATVANLTITLSNADFNVESENCPTNLLAGGSCTITVEFTPATNGDKSALLTVSGDGGVSDEATLFGRAGDGATLVYTQGDPAFGGVVEGDTVSETFVIENQGDEGTFFAIEISGANAGIFRFDTFDQVTFAGFIFIIEEVVNTNCGGNREISNPNTTTTFIDNNFLAPGQSCAIVVNFGDPSSGTYTADMALQPDNANGTGETVTFTGTVGTASMLEVTPDPVECGDTVPAESTVACPTVAIENNGTLASSEFDITIAGGQAGQFELVSTTCARNADDDAYASLAGGASCTATVEYTPNAVDADASTLSVTGGGSVALEGVGVRALSTTATTATLTAAVGESTSQQFTYTNAAGTPATGPLTIEVTGPNANEFAVFGDCAGAVLAPAGTCSLTVVFSPETIGNSKSADLRVGDGSTPKTSLDVALTGVGQ